MNLLKFQEFYSFCQKIQGRSIVTLTGKKVFEVVVVDSKINIITSSGKFRKLEAGKTDEVLNILHKTGNWATSNYNKITMNASYILGIEKIRNDNLNRLNAIDVRLRSNNYCEVWNEVSWQIVSVEHALVADYDLVRCLECYGGVRLHRAGRNNSTRAHAEHLQRHEGCSLGHYFTRINFIHPMPIMGPNLGNINDIENLISDEEDESSRPEGKEKYNLHKKLERDPGLSKRVKAERLIKTGKLSCEVCSFDFAKIFGKVGLGFIEAHHKIPVHMLDGETITKASDLALVCANCHRMLHRGKPVFTIDELQRLLIT